MIQSEEVFYKICFDSLLEGICIANEEGRIVMINSALEDIFGYKKDELIDKNIDLLIPEAHRNIHLKHFDSYLKSPKKYKKGKGREFLGLHKDGSILDLEIGLNYFQLDGSLYAKALISEISTRKQKELLIKEKNRDLKIEVEKKTTSLEKAVTELERSNSKLKDEIRERIITENRAKRAFEREKEFNLMQTKFISMASHEFKTPLSGILTSASLIEKYNSRQPNDKIGNHAFTIKTLVNQLNNILDDFLFLENTESENYALRLSRFKFCGLVQRLIKDAQAVLKDGQTIVFEPCKIPVEVYQDQKVIDIIIRNVLYNAIKYSTENSKIYLKVTHNEYLKIIIQDHGIGIPKEAQEHVFERFYRAKNALPIQGTGIGLNIAKRYLDKLRGRIHLESEEAKGTTVCIELPIEHKMKDMD